MADYLNELNTLQYYFESKRIYKTFDNFVESATITANDLHLEPILEGHVITKTITI